MVARIEAVSQELPSEALSNGAVDINTTEKKDLTPLKSRLPRQKRPNYAQIHSRPLPREIHPLPVFIPHNPLSVVRIAIALISHSIWPPSSPQSVHKAYFSPETQSIHVTDPRSVRALWEQGFFGTGSLSRSEPRWLDQEKRRRGVEALLTSEEITQQRRAERRNFKLERAQKEREAIEQQLRLEGKIDASEITDGAAVEVGAINVLNGAGTVAEQPTKEVAEVANMRVGAANVLTPDSSKEDTIDLDTNENLQDSKEGNIRNEEHLQLTLEESFFLTYVLGALEIVGNETTLPSTYLFRLFCAHSSYPISEDTGTHLWDLYQTCTGTHSDPLGATDVHPILPDNPFILRYVVYHHFRSLGWVPRAGIKFGIDFLIYNRGPAFSHAEFGIMIIPAYSHPYWSETRERKAECEKKTYRDWWWFHRINRVQTQVLKTLTLIYVEVPPPWDDEHMSEGFTIDIGNTLKKYKVREFVFKRWTPNRNRD